jgi:transcriptional regulator with XRE-family HTH domain
MAKFKTWWKEAASSEKKQVAEFASSSVMTLWQYANGTRRPSPDMAGRLEEAIAIVNRLPRHKKLPEVTRGDLNDVCATCKYYKECKS